MAAASNIGSEIRRIKAKKDLIVMYGTGQVETV
jgi:hypothetical protein